MKESKSEGRKNIVGMIILFSIGGYGGLRCSGEIRIGKEGNWERCVEVIEWGLCLMGCGY